MTFSITATGAAWFSADGIVLKDDRLPGNPRGGTLPWRSFRRIGLVTEFTSVDDDYVAVELEDGRHLWSWATDRDRHAGWNEVLAAHFFGARTLRGQVAQHPVSDAKDCRYRSEVLWPPEQAGQPLYRVRTDRHLLVLHRHDFEPTPFDAPRV